jgi:outer membrane protein assembly factor BamB
MKTVGGGRWSVLIIAGVVLMAFLALVFWLKSGSDETLGPRLPGADQAPGGAGTLQSNPVLIGKLTRSEGKPADLPGAWPGFRGPARDGKAENPTIARTWQSSGPREVWSIEVGEGYAGAAIRDGRVYLMDYDREQKQDALRCLSLADGQEIWRYTYPVNLKRNHGMSRTVPAVSETVVVAIGPKCHVVCADAKTGELRWGIDLVREYGATIPPWYAGQCPLLDGGAVVLAPGGPRAFLVALDSETGKERWRSPNPRGWKMTHSSVMPLEIDGKKVLVYCANNGLVAVSAADGAPLWETDEWKISIATVPSPLVIDGGRIFLSGGYSAGSMMIELKASGDGLSGRTIFKLGPQVFGATQQTPIFYNNNIYGVRADGKFVCLDLEGKVVWASTGGPFGLGSFIMGDGLVLALNDSGLLRLIEASPAKYGLLGEAQVLKGRESWGPMALAGGRVIARDLTRMICLDISGK